MSQTEAKRHFIGVGQLFWSNARIGGLKSTSTLIREEDTAYHKNGEEKGHSAYHLIEEREFVEVQVADIKIEQYRFLIGAANALESAGSLDSATTNTNFRNTEDLLLIGTTAKTLSRVTNALNVGVFSLDRETEHIVTTDYTVDTAAGTITRVSAAGIDSGGTVRVDYQFTDTSAAVVKVGGQEQKYEAELIFVVKTSNGKLLQFTGYRAIREAGFDIEFNETDYAPITVRFKLLHDLTKPKGEQLHEFAIED